MPAYVDVQVLNDSCMHVSHNHINIWSMHLKLILYVKQIENLMNRIKFKYSKNGLINHIKYLANISNIKQYQVVLSMV